MTDTVLAFLFYCVVVAIFSSVMIYKVAPKHGKTHPLIYISICSTVGSVSVMSVSHVDIEMLHVTYIDVGNWLSALLK